MGWGESVYLSIHPRNCTQRSVESKQASEHLFFGGEVFFCFFFFLDRVGELAAAEEK